MMRTTLPSVSDIRHHPARQVGRLPLY
jgi:hypothetical protein